MIKIRDLPMGPQGDVEMDADHTLFVANHILMIFGGGLGFLLLVALGVLFFVSRRTQKVMESMLVLMTRPERAKVHDAARVLQTILADEITKIRDNFQSMSAALTTQIDAAVKLKQELGTHNDALVGLANGASQKMAQMTQRLDNTVAGLQAVVESVSWRAASESAERFTSNINELLSKIDSTTQDVDDRTNRIQGQIDAWMDRGEKLTQQLQAGFDQNAKQMQELGTGADDMQQRLGTLAQTTADGFNNIKTAAADYATVLADNDKLLTDHLVKLDTFGKQSKKQLTSQVNTLTSTANVVGGQVRLAESSIEKQVRKLADAVEALMASATKTEASVRGISTELATLTNRFNGEIKEFATGVVGELNQVSGVANATLENTKTAAGAFSESVRAMATGVRETLMEMNTAHTQLSGQSENLIKMSSDTTRQLQPLSELIERYYTALPDLSRGSAEMGENLEKIVTNLNDKIGQMRTTIAESVSTIGDSSQKLEDLAGQSRQQMIDLMADYAKAVGTMQTLNKQMMVARATAPMEAIKAAPAASFAPISHQDFMQHCARQIEKLHDQSLDLTRAAGAEIPDVVWKKYHAGDKTIFSKWLAKMLTAADKKQVRDLMKSDSVFRSQATQFVRAFAKMLAPADQADNRDAIVATFMKSDLGQIYTVLRGGLA